MSTNQNDDSIICQIDDDMKAQMSPYLLGYKPPEMKISDGSTASYYELPPGATELKHLIWFKNMNAQVGEIFRSAYRLNDCPHSDAIRNLNKIIAYAEQEKERLMTYGGY